ncbi:hypothetical protein CPB86DRAFT_720489, partial [Serendipita vermifera]
DARTGQAIGNPLQGHTHSVHSVTFSLDGHQVASGSQDHTVMLWDARTDQVFCEILRACNSSFPFPHGPHFSVPGFNNCTLLEDGWVRSSGKLLYWVPPHNRHGIQHPYTLVMPITTSLCATWIDFSHFHCGPTWTNGQGSPQ